MATRFDYLRIAKAIMDDYQNDTCVGKYLKEIYEEEYQKEAKKKKSPYLIVQNHTGVNFIWIFQD